MKSVLSQTDIDMIRDRYEGRFRQYGYSPKTLDWDKGKQDIRFSVLTSQLDFQGCSVLDIGCGFGDLNRTLAEQASSEYTYLGVDVVPSLVKEGERLFGSDHVRFLCGDVLAMDLPQVDYAICSGMFNLKMSGEKNMEFIRAVAKKTFGLCRIGFAFDFLSDKVDYRKEITFHSSPEEILAMAYKLSRNVMLCNNYMPFEFSLFVFKDESFDPALTVFNRWMSA